MTMRDLDKETSTFLTPFKFTNGPLDKCFTCRAVHSLNEVCLFDHLVSSICQNSLFIGINGDQFISDFLKITIFSLLNNATLDMIGHDHGIQHF